MVQINFHKREVNCKVVYYGPGLSGKTTNLEVVHEKAPQGRKGELTSIATEGDRTLFFDFMPLNLGKVGGMETKFQLYTVPGQVYYNATRKLVLQGADGVVFVADSQAEKLQENLESLKNLEDNLKEHNIDIRKIPLVIQWNKRDLPTALPLKDLEEKLNTYGAPTFEAVAVTGEGVFPTLKKLSQMVLERLNDQYQIGPSKGQKPKVEEPAAEEVPAAAEGQAEAAAKPAEVKPAAKSGEKPAAKPAEAKPAAAKPAEARPAAAKPAEARPAAAKPAEAKPAPKPEAKPARPEAKPAPKPEARPVPKPAEAKPAAKPEPKPGAKPAPKPAPVAVAAREKPAHAQAGGLKVVEAPKESSVVLYIVIGVVVLAIAGGAAYAKFVLHLF